MSYEYVRGTVPTVRYVDTERLNDFFDCFSKMLMQNGFNSLLLRQASAVRNMILM